jgi:hypothetical protein
MFYLRRRCREILLTPAGFDDLYWLDTLLQGAESPLSSVPAGPIQTPGCLSAPP